jgi:ABC-type amino acid transport substrate-binding protein
VTDPTVDFVHDLNNRLLAIRAYTTLALTALEDGDADAAATAAPELRALLEVVDETTLASRTFRGTLASPSV